MEDSANVTMRIDIGGSLPLRYLGGNRYVTTMTTTPRRYAYMQTMKTRDENPKSCYDQKVWMDRNGEESVKGVHSDNAKESLGMKKVLKKM